VEVQRLALTRSQTRFDIVWADDGRVRTGAEVYRAHAKVVADDPFGSTPGRAVDVDLDDIL